MCTQFSVDGRLFSAEVVARTAYRYRSIASVEVRTEGADFEIKLTPLVTPSGDLEVQFRADLWDDRLRERIAAQTQSLQQELIRVALRQALGASR